MGFHHRKITPAWPKANSESERFMRTLNKTLRAAHLENKNWQQELFLFLRNYRATPHSTTGVSPAELLFGRKLGVKLPELIKTAPSRSLIADADRHETKGEEKKKYADTRSKAQHRTQQIGDTVLVREQRKHKLSSPYNKIPYTVTSIKGTMITTTNVYVHSITRNCSQFKSIKGPAKHAEIDDDSLDDEEISIPTPEPPIERRYPVGQNRRPPLRLNNQYEH